MEEEIWEIIPDYSNYSISNTGKIKTLPKLKKHSSSDTYYWTKEKILKSNIDIWGYERVSLYFEYKKQRHLKIHRLVAQAFIPNPENKPYVNHIDGNKLNNHVSNLEWVTAKENTQHSYNIGLQKYKNFDTKYYGVSYDKWSKSYRCSITSNGEIVFRKRFKTELEAALAYNDFIENSKMDRPLNEIPI